MKRRQWLSLFLAALLLTGSAIPVLAASGRQYLYAAWSIPTGSMRTIAHQGYSAVAPGNTLPAYIAAGEAGFWGAECDISRTVDGVWVLMHDDSVDRTTNGTGRVDELTYEEITALTVDDGANLDRYPDTKVPTLIEYLDVCKRFGMHPVIEIKSSAKAADMDDLASLLGAREEKSMFEIITFERELAVRIKTLMPQTPVYLLVSTDATQDDIDFSVQAGLDGMDFHCYLPKKYVKAVRKAGLKTIVWTIDDLKTASRFFRYGVTDITTNSLTPGTPEGTAVQHLIWTIRDRLFALLCPGKTVEAVA